MGQQRTICFIVSNFITERVGGVEIQTFLIGKYLTQKQWNVVFIAETSDSQKTGSITTHDNIAVYWIRRKSLFSFFRRDLMNALQAVKPDFVYQRGRSRFTSSPVPYRFTELNECSLIYHCAEDNDLVDKFNRKELKKHKINLLKCIPLYIHARLADYFFKQTISKSNLILVQSNHQLDGFESVYNKRPILVNSGHEVPNPPFYKNENFYIFWIANTGRRKQLELFVKLARQLQYTKAEFIFAGTMPHKDYWQEIQILMDGLANIRYIGALNWQESNVWFSKASILINTTLAGREGFPNTYIQAWMHETPVITLHCDPDGVIESNELGFHSRTFEQMVCDVKKLIEDDSLRKSMGRNARTYALDHHDIKKTIEQFHRIFSEMA